MKIQLTIETEPQDLTRCIVAAYNKDNNEIDASQIKPFSLGESVLPDDVKNMLRGSCFGELAKNGNAEMKIIEL